MELSELMNAEELHLKKLQDLVIDAIKEEELLSEKLIELETDKKISFGSKLADKVADFGGSWLFITLFALILLFWIISNVYFLRSEAFDPYPFILLNLVLSCIAALQAPIIMMSQNRKEDKDRMRARSDYMVNMKAEMEVRNLHRKIDLLISEQMQYLFKIQQAQLDILLKLEKKSNSN